MSMVPIVFSFWLTLNQELVCKILEALVVIQSCHFPFFSFYCKFEAFELQKEVKKRAVLKMAVASVYGLMFKTIFLFWRHVDGGFWLLCNWAWCVHESEWSHCALCAEAHTNDLELLQSYSLQPLLSRNTFQHQRKTNIIHFGLWLVTV